MNRREFIRKTTSALPAAAAMSVMPQFVSNALAAAADKWRVFEVTTKVGVLKPAGVSRVWLPLPLAADTDFQKNLGSTWSAEGGTATVVTDGKYGAEMLYFEASSSDKVPAVQVTSRFATRDRAVDLSKPGSGAKADRVELQRYLAPTELIPTDGIVRDTARDIYGVRVAKSGFGYRSLGVGTDIVTRAQHCRAEFYSAAYGWVPVDPADVRKVVLEERADGQLLTLDDQHRLAEETNRELAA